MIIKNQDTPGVSQLDLDRTSGSRRSGDAAASNLASANQTPTTDSIALSTSTDLVQQALNSGASAREARIQELQQLIGASQYHVDAATLSLSIINAHLAGD